LALLNHVFLCIGLPAQALRVRLSLLNVATGCRNAAAKQRRLQRGHCTVCGSEYCHNDVCWMLISGSHIEQAASRLTLRIDHRFGLFCLRLLNLFDIRLGTLDLCTHLLCFLELRWLLRRLK
jgi:hypothetical protein